MDWKRVMPTTWLLVALILEVVLHFAFPIRQLVPRVWNLLGLIPIGLGVAINLLADRALHTAETTVKPFQRSSALITDGVYGRTRHPMYLGFVAILVGEAVLLRSLSPYAVAFLFALLLDRAYIVVEERMMAASFGARWEEYRGRTRRWL
jgi:protein-S-isoprenylcysteine O-methyltransferase Ste14